MVAYRGMWQRLINEYNLVNDKKTVRRSLKLVDPAGVELRSRHRLRRRQYREKGPNLIWHVDGMTNSNPLDFVSTAVLMDTADVFFGLTLL